jgi:hypothetical protein
MTTKKGTQEAGTSKAEQTSAAAPLHGNSADYEERVNQMARALSFDTLLPVIHRVALATGEDEGKMSDLLVLFAAAAFTKEPNYAESIFIELTGAMMPYMEGAHREANVFVCRAIEAARVK